MTKPRRAGPAGCHAARRMVVVACALLAGLLPPLAGAQGTHHGAPSRASGPPDLLAPLPADEKRVADLVRNAGRAAARLDGDYFVLVYTARPALARDLLRRVEATYRAHVSFFTACGVPLRRPDHKLPALLFATHAEFATYARVHSTAAADALGYFDLGANCSIFFDLDTHPALAQIRATAEAAPPEERTRLRRRLEHRRTALELCVVQHEAAHQIQQNCGLAIGRGAAPTWLAEGLAMLFELPPGADPSAADAPNTYRLFEYQKLYRTSAPSGAQLRNLLTDDEAWCGGECYPLAWAVIRHLRVERPTGFTALVRLLAEPEKLPRSPAARAVLLERLLGRLDDRWADDVHRATMALTVDPAFGE